VTLARKCERNFGSEHQVEAASKTQFRPAPFTPIAVRLVIVMMNLPVIQGEEQSSCLSWLSSWWMFLWAVPAFKNDYFSSAVAAEKPAQHADGGAKTTVKIRCHFVVVVTGSHCQVILRLNSSHHLPLLISDVLNSTDALVYRAWIITLGKHSLLWISRDWIIWMSRFNRSSLLRWAVPA